MTAEVESMMYVGQTPWHGLGVPLQGNPSIDEAIVAAGLDWQVETRPLFTDDGLATDHKAVVRMTDRRVLGVVGPKSHVLQNRAAFDWFKPILDAGDAVLETAGSLREGERVWILARICVDPIEIIPGDVVRRYLLLSNGHDGKLAVRLGSTNIRVVCANTLKEAHSAASSRLLRMTHHSKMAETMETVREIINLASRAFEATLEQYRFLASRPVNQSDLRRYVKRVFAQRATAVDEFAAAVLPGGAEMVEAAQSRRGDVVFSRVAELYETGAGAELRGVKGTWWGAYNAITNYLSHESGNSDAGRLNSLWFGRGDSLGARALEVAAQMGGAQ